MERKTTGEKGDVRFRDAGVFNYVFRSIEENMPWVRYIFLILASETQIPSWLNVNNSKLKIVYHNEFIPKEELPTFNSSVINTYIPNIEELSEHYILFNDDMFVFNYTNKEEWFYKDKSVAYKQHNSYHKNGSWEENIINSKKLAENLTGIYCDCNPEHGPIPFIKSFNKFCLLKANNIITEALHNTRFRNKKNITDWFYFFMMSNTNKLYVINESKVSYTRNENFPTVFKTVVCFNDTIAIKNYEKYKVKLKNVLNKRFPKKSSFEI